MRMKSGEEEEGGGGRRRVKERRGSEDELGSTFLALLIYMRGTARYRSTYILSMVYNCHGGHTSSMLHTYSSACLSNYQICRRYQDRPRIPSDDDSTPLLPSDGTYSFGGKPLYRIFSTDGMERDVRT
jgi:hypothetical protein